jgi:hypothetical protein
VTDHDGVVSGCPVLRLRAAAARNEEAQGRHALSQRIVDLALGPYQVTIWVKPLSAVNLQLHVRDSVNPESGSPANEGEARFDLAAPSVATVNNLPSAEIAESDDGWRKVTATVRTDDGRLFVYLGMLRPVDNSHVFDAGEEQLLFGGIEVRALST